MILKGEKVIGLIALHTKINEGVYEIGFELNSKYHRLGIMHYVLNHYINEMCQKHTIKKIVAEVLKKNSASIKLLEKNQFIKISENELEYYYERKF